MAETEARCKGLDAELQRLKAELHSAQKQRDASVTTLDEARSECQELQKAATHAAAQQRASVQVCEHTTLLWLATSDADHLTVCRHLNHLTGFNTPNSFVRRGQTSRSQS